MEEPAAPVVGESDEYAEPEFGPAPDGEEVSDESSWVEPVDEPSDDAAFEEADAPQLAETGGEVSSLVLGLAGALMAAGGSLLFRARTATNNTH